MNLKTENKSFLNHKHKIKIMIQCQLITNTLHQRQRSQNLKDLKEIKQMKCQENVRKCYKHC